MVLRNKRTTIVRSRKLQTESKNKQINGMSDSIPSQLPWISTAPGDKTLLKRCTEREHTEKNLVQNDSQIEISDVQKTYTIYCSASSSCTVSNEIDNRMRSVLIEHYNNVAMRRNLKADVERNSVNHSSLPNKNYQA